jgi:hypothetical protein
MTKRLVLGDPHGKWWCIEDIYHRENPDEVIILGDYFDSFNIYPEEQRDCYDKIINLRREHISKKKGNKFIMLIGNHDFHYMDENFGRCSGWNPSTCSLAMFRLCRDWDKGILNFCYVDEINMTIYSHAGVSKNWFDSWIKSKNLGDINTIETKAFCFTYKEGGNSYGSSSWNSPLWIRPEGLIKSPYKDNNGNIWNQVFGHTEKNVPMIIEIDNSKFYDLDCISRNYMIEILNDKRELVNRKIKPNFHE